jgi:lambda family phage portal protein
MSKLLHKLARRFGYIPRESVAMDLLRAYAAAKQSRLLNDWVAGNQSAAEEVRGGLKPLRERARELERDDDYVFRYLKMQVKNIVGQNGIVLQSQAKTAAGKTDAEAAASIELAWRQWGKVGSCTVDGTRSWVDVQKLAVRSLKRDGEILIRMLRGWKNGYGFALQLLEGDYLDHDLNTDPTGNKRDVRMGIEYDAWQRPTAYYLFTSHPGDYIAWRGHKYIRIPAAEIIHLFDEERVDQRRGVSQMHASMIRLNHLKGYEEAELIAARSDACKGGFYYEEGNQYEGDEKDTDGNLLQELSPGFMERLPFGVKFQAHLPQHPSGVYQQFRDSCLRGIGSGLDTNYNHLANDFVGVSYSSMRSAELDARDGYKIDQTYLVEHLCEAVFSAWLTMALLSDAIADCNILDEPRLSAHKWQPRTWTWVDPMADAKADAIAEARGWKSKTQIAGQYGSDLEDVAKDKQREAEIEATYGVKLQEERDEQKPETQTGD